MSTNGAFWVSRCPLEVVALCHWQSEPSSTETLATEALRAHVSAHHHGDLVAFAAAHADALVRYERSEAS